MQKDEKRLRNLWDNFKHSNIWIMGMPEGEEEEQDIENLFEQITKENFIILVKSILDLLFILLCFSAYHISWVMFDIFLDLMKPNS